MPKDAAHTKGWQIGEVVFGTPLVAAILLQQTVPLPVVGAFFTSPVRLLGLVFCAAGIALIRAARREFARQQQPTDPGVPTRFVVTTGMFSVSRNPMYLGALCFLVGVALSFKLAWLFALLIPTLLACHAVLIAPEERYLEAKFGAAYSRYTASVRRWLGRKPQSGEP